MLIPAPKLVNLSNSDKYFFTTETKIYADAPFISVARALAPTLNVAVSDGEDGDIRILCKETPSDVTKTSADAYSLDCDLNGMVIKARTLQGAAMALADIKQLKRTDEGGAYMPYVHIENEPEYEWRTLNLDICRHFFGLDTIKKVIDFMWLYKFNTLHFHVSDDQGYRIESERYPLLNSVGSYRKSSATKRGNGEVQDGKPHGGYLKKTEVRELVAYASERGIKIVPEIDIPGHTTAIIAAYPKLACFEQKTEVATQYGFKDFSAHILCSAKEEVYELLFGLIDELAELFPSDYFHIGGDEAKKGEWKKCPACQALKREKGLKTERELQGYMLARVRDHVKSIGREAIVWNDGYSENMGSDIICQQWTPKTVEGSRRTKALLARGGKAVFSGFEHLYLDYPFSMTPLKKTYSYQLPELDEACRAGVLGIECCLWGEWIEDERKLFYCLLPRLAAVSQIAWNGDKRGSYEDFCERLQSHYAFYDEANVNYAKGREKSEGLIKRALRTRTWFFKDAYIEVE